ncbi:hypothetical protein J5N97_015955 [Dioscorea zingiberensis]|uniref:J domain-containing protein n=1 Tax=Dioscorea zingiberensis TaxID=325984 RepID=A0A9D5CL38_9LILI|nr:hypothetical protein J5N97_015955 [Dioscorea zingiberensis]
MAKPKKRCYYEVLGVSRNATADEIRCSYRHRALQLHPDKQAASGTLSAADATVAFQELLEAYSVLSDPEKRDCYDTEHPDAGNSLSRSSDFTPFFDLSRFFSCECFHGSTDPRKAFYKVYGGVFSKIHSQELYFARKLGLGLDPPPPIGNLYCSDAQLRAFYIHWLGFSTVIDFDWLDEEDRFEARSSWNGMVRDLAAFVKRMDWRFFDNDIRRRREREEYEKVRRRKEREEHEKAREKEVAENKEIANMRKYWSTLARDVPFAGLMVTFYEALKDLTDFGKQKLLPSRSDLHVSNSFEGLILGGLAGGLSAYLTTPFDVIKTGLQVQGSIIRYNGWSDALRRTWMTEGLNGMFKGSIPRVIWYIPASALTFMAVEFLRDHFKEKTEDDVHEITSSSLDTSSKIQEAV